MTASLMVKVQKRMSCINRNVLGRKRETIEQEVVEEEEELPEIGNMKINLMTETLQDRETLIEDCLELYDKTSEKPNVLLKGLHKIFLDYAFTHPLPSGFKSLDASQPWLLYWIGNSLKLLNRNWLTTDYQKKILSKLWSISPTGGPFNGGKHQLPHLTTNYAAINAIALCDVENRDDKQEINKQAIYDWLISLKTDGGAFYTVKPVGEQDVRGVYAALTVASLLGIMDEKLIDGVTDFLIRCQSYEGGFGGCPGDEAHGGYTFCAVASLALLDALDKINIQTLMSWCSSRQAREERGLNGRSNKLVDGCYSFWVGGTAAILEAYRYGVCIDKHALKQYILRCCQEEGVPGLRDKPGKQPDYYHTNYVLAGLSICEYSFEATKKNECCTFDITATPLSSSCDVEPINPIFGLPEQDVRRLILQNATNNTM